MGMETNRQDRLAPFGDDKDQDGSLAPVEPSYIEAFATSMPRRLATWSGTEQDLERALRDLRLIGR